MWLELEQTPPTGHCQSQHGVCAAAAASLATYDGHGLSADTSVDRSRAMLVPHEWCVPRSHTPPPLRGPIRAIWHLMHLTPPDMFPDHNRATVASHLV